MSARSWRRWLPWVGLLGLAALLCLLPDLAHARPGGGHSFSGGGSSSGGGGGGSGDLIAFLIILCIQHPYIGIPVTIVVAIYYFKFVRGKKNLQRQRWDSAPPHPMRRPRVSLDALRAVDPDFSRVTFEDFAYKLYAKAHESRHDPKALEALAPYLNERTRMELAARPPREAIRGVVVGAMAISRVTVPQAQPGSEAEQFARIVLSFTSNMTGGNQTWFVQEIWTLKRALSARTPPPDEVGDFHCPSCGAPFESSDRVHCAHCNQPVTDGRFAWCVETVMLTSAVPRPPTLTGHAPEVGTNWPTVIDPRYEQKRQELLADDPACTGAAIGGRLQKIYDELNAAWSKLDLSPARPYVSDNLYNYLGYWIMAYRKSGLRNALEDMRLLKWTGVKIVRDKYYDSMTVRVWGTGKDYTVDEDGRVVGGSRTVPRRYSEYWTLIRAAGAQGAPRADANCPNCAAPLKVNMGGTCEYCGSHLTRGEFDWVLSKIEQDEVYAG